MIYVVSRRLTFLCEAIASAESAKTMAPDVHITLMTDLRSIPHIPPFDRVVQINATLPHDASCNDAESWARGLYAKLVGVRESPYERTLYLDTDTRILRPEVRDIFGYLSHCSIAMTPCRPENSHDCFQYGPMYSAGVIAFRRDNDTQSLFERWDAQHRYHLSLARPGAIGEVPALSHLTGPEKVRMLVSDQTSLAELLSPCHNEYNIQVKPLDEIWNARGRPRDQLSNVIIDHADCHKVRPQDTARLLATRGIDIATMAAQV